MIIIVPDVLKPEQVKRIHEVLEKGVYMDGRKTAGSEAAKVKNNLQLDHAKTKDAEEIEQMVVKGLTQNRLVSLSGLPAKMRRPYFSIYGEGMEYGSHVDNPVMGTTNKLRTDLSVTLFLADPKSYDGGELSIDLETGNQEIKLPPGHAVMYPTNFVHRVKKVTRGRRIAAITWIESMVADPNRRRLLHELGETADRLRTKLPGSEEYLSVHSVYGSLLRLWGQP